MKFIARKGVFTEKELTKALSGYVGAVAEAEATSSQNLKDVLVTIPTGSPSTSAFESERNKNNAREVIGASPMDLANFDSPSARRTVGEVTSVRQGAARRSGKRYTMVSNLYTDAIMKINRLVFGLWKTPRYSLVGKDYVQFTGDELKGEYSLDVSLSTRRNLSKAERKIEALTLLPNFLGLPGINIPVLYQYLVDATGDPAFEGILAAASRGQPNRAALNPGQGNANSSVEGK